MELSVDSIPYIAMAMAHENVMSAVGTRMLETSLDVASSQIDSLTRAMELSVNPAVGGNIDISV